MVSLSVVALAKDAAQHLPRFFTCLEGLADQVIIGDLGSTDGTIEAAKKQGAQVLPITDKDDYAKARNRLLAMAQSEWVLVLDCHETMSNPDLKRLKDFLEHTEHEVFIFTIRNYTEDRHLMGWRPSDIAAYTGYVPAKQARLFRNKPFIRFSYPVHETLMPSIEGKGLDVKEIQDIAIHNHDYTDQLEHFYNILKGLKQNYPDDLKITYDLALAHLRKGHLGSAKSLFSEIVQRMPSYKNALTNLATIVLREGDHYNAAKLFLKAIDNDPKDINAYHNMGQLLWKKGDHEKAEFFFKKALTIEHKEPRLIAALAKVYRSQGRDDEARSLIERGLRMLPKNAILTEALSRLK